MASIFTYDPDPPRVASPWLRGATPDVSASGAEGSNFGMPAKDRDTNQNGNPPVEDFPITRLEAEPQEGPVEYKLHLLLRPRRKFRSTSTGTHISGSKHSRYGPKKSSQRVVTEPTLESNPDSSPGASLQILTQQTRQHRLEQLTTQLLWRLQQSSPHHASSATNFILPSLPEALPELQAPQQPAKLLHGLEESQGALYEIGVADDGTLIGLAEDEMDESVQNLRAMAACLGCVVEVLRKEAVGECEWLEESVVGRKERQYRRKGKLVVVEALIKPRLQSKSSPSFDTEAYSNEHESGKRQEQPASTDTEQLRVTLAGPTMSGKSSLLGTLTTSTLDNGKGQSRLSMLRHRHEINSGLTSSVTQEILGYHDGIDGSVHIVNYADDDMASWIDVHNASHGGRLVLVSDSAGHPRYRRTTIRGLVGWAPHCVLLCIPADDSEDTTGRQGSTFGSQQALSSAVLDTDLSGAQLDLCLRLGLPLVVVITKLDLASKTGLKRSLSKILDALKAAGRKPEILRNSPGGGSEDGLSLITASTVEVGYHASLPLLNGSTDSVPIVLTSAVQGSGINNLHALLHELPIPDAAATAANATELVFHIEDVYSKAAEVEGVIVSGTLRFGQISVGDTATLGPFSIHYMEDSEDSDERPTRASSSSRLPTSRSFPGALRNAHIGRAHFQLPNREWRRVRVVSVRNLRLPVHTLLPDQAGTLALAPCDENDAQSLSGKTEEHTKAAFSARIRKGMVLTTVPPRPARTFVADFKREDLESLAVGNHVVVYIASVRASARVVSARVPETPMLGEGTSMVEKEDEAGMEETNASQDPFGFDDEEGDFASTTDGQSEKIAHPGVTAPRLLVTFRFEASREFLLVGDQVLVMPGGGPGLGGGTERGEKGIAGLEGFVGWVREVGE